MRMRTEGAGLFDRLERAIIALEYALADARVPPIDGLAHGFDGVSRAQEALQQAGEEVQEVLAALKSQALQAAAAGAREWAEDAVSSRSAVRETAQP